MKIITSLISVSFPLVFAAAAWAAQSPSLEAAYAGARTAIAGPRAEAAVPQPVREIAADQAQPIWPLPSPSEWYWHKPNSGLSQFQINASMAGIKSGYFFRPGYTSGSITAVSVNKKKIQFSLTAAGTSQEVYFPVKLLKYVRMYYASSQSQGQKWLVAMTLEATTLQAYFKTEAEARLFIDAAVSAARMAKVTLEDKEKRGFYVSDLTPAQAQALGKPRIDSALVTMLAYGGPAEKAGILFLDLITEVDGVKIRNADHFASILDAAAPGSTLRLSCLERTEVTVDGVKDYVWKDKTIEFTLE